MTLLGQDARENKIERSKTTNNPHFSLSFRQKRQKIDNRTTRAEGLAPLHRRSTLCYGNHVELILICDDLQYLYFEEHYKKAFKFSFQIYWNKQLTISLVRRFIMIKFVISSCSIRSLFSSLECKKFIMDKKAHLLQVLCQIQYSSKKFYLLRHSKWCQALDRDGDWGSQ